MHFHIVDGGGGGGGGGDVCVGGTGPQTESYL